MEDALIQLVSAWVGSVGFALVFNVEKKCVIAASLGGLLIWGVFLLCDSLLSLGVFSSTVIAAASGQIYSEIMARIYKSPTTVFFIPGVVPLIPGGSLYRTMYAAVFQNWEQCRYYGIQTLLGTLGIAVGLSFVSGVLYILANRAKQKATRR